MSTSCSPSQTLPTSSAGQTLAIDAWGAGRLLVNATEAAWLTEQGLTTIDAVFHLKADDVYRQVGERVTSRHELPSASGPRVVYIKRHGAITWKERLKAYSRLSWPAWGARPEWEAIVAFHRLGVPTMTPILCGEQAGRSILMTASLEDCTRLDHWFASAESRDVSQRSVRQQILLSLADMVRRMHTAGYHHQDLYLCHVLWAKAEHPVRLYLIDLGRVQRHSAWTARRWRAKDLAQLLYSAKDCTRAEQLRFLRTYLQRPLRKSDRRLIRWLMWKAQRIGRHTRRHGL
ncbi:hypothetical protein GC163_14010 [bacterium]|nr:hypothetical protein [bacterium]